MHTQNNKHAFAVFNRSRRTSKENWKMRIARKNLWRKSMFHFDVATSLTYVTRNAIIFSLFKIINNTARHKNATIHARYRFITSIELIWLCIFLYEYLLHRYYSEF